MKGAVGCAKSSANCTDIMYNASLQEAAEDGKRYTRFAILRNTYPELKTTTIPTWLAWFPEEQFGNMKRDVPITHHIKKGDIDCEVLFLSIESEADIKKLMSLELTGAFVNELQFFPKRVWDVLQERVNRYPSTKVCPRITYPHVSADTNPPDQDHWIYALEQNTPSNMKIFNYPPAVLKVKEIPYGTQGARSLDGTFYINNPDADFLKNLQQNYYLNLIPGKRDADINVNICGNYGYVQDGKPVYPEYNAHIHYSDEMRYSSDLRIGLGWDFGLTPACVVTQFTPMGRVHILREFTSQELGLESFIKMVVIPGLNTNFPGWQNNYISIGDPAGNSRVQTDEKTCFDILRKFGIITRPAKTNSPRARMESVKYFLNIMITGKGAILVGKDSPQVKKGLEGAYKFKRMSVGGNEMIYHDEPVKNFASHPADALQYIVLEYYHQVAQPELNKGISLSTKSY